MGKLNALGELNRIVYTLATDVGEIKPRLSKALKRSFIMDSDFPDDLKSEWRRLRTEFEKRGPMLNRDGSVYMSADQNTIRRMRKATASKIAERLVDLYFALSRKV